jgi:hypothetical protein
LIQACDVFSALSRWQSIKMAADGKSLFKDRRFGEGNESLTAEAKKLARFQRERSRQLKRAAKFNLEAQAASGRLSGTADVLTHGGKVRTGAQ